MPKLTLSMIVKNEEKYLRECLQSVEGIVDEIVIVDTGSTDKTLEIAQEFKANIFHFNWINDFSAARNFALSKSTGNWILYLDADERLNKKSKSELLKKINSKNKEGINCRINNLDDYNNSPKLMKYIRLFSNSDNILFSGKAHEQIESSLIKENYKISDSTIEIIHIGYNVPEEELRIKAKRNLGLLLEDYKNIPTSYLAFQIGNSYSILEEIEKSIIYYDEALKDLHLRKEFKLVCYLNKADYKMRSNDLTDAKNIVDTALKLDDNHSLLNMVGAQIYDKLNMSEKSIQLCKKALNENNKIKGNKRSKNVIDIIADNKKIIFEGVLLSLKYNSAENLNYFLHKLKKEDESFHQILYGIVNNQIDNQLKLDSLIKFTNENNCSVIFNLLKYNSNIEGKLEFFSSIYDKFNNNTEYLREFGLFLLNINQVEEARVFFEQALTFENYDESIIFYLASIYVSINKKEELKNLLLMADSKPNQSPIYISKLSVLKEKLIPILNVA